MGMNIERRRVKSHNKEKIRGNRRYNLIANIKEVVYDVSLSEFREMIEYDEGEEGDFDEVSEDLSSEFEQRDSELEEYDEDDPHFEPYLENNEQDNIDYQFIADEEYFLDLENFYILSITKKDDSYDKYLCNFIVPAWFEDGKRSKKFRGHIVAIENFLNGMSKWFEEEKQEFLKNPIIDEFGKITQQTLIKKIKEKSTKSRGKSKKDGFDDKKFSKLKDKIYLIWEDKSLSIKDIF